MNWLYYSSLFTDFFNFNPIFSIGTIMYPQEIEWNFKKTESDRCISDSFKNVCVCMCLKYILGATISTSARAFFPENVRMFGKKGNRYLHLCDRLKTTVVIAAAVTVAPKHNFLYDRIFFIAAYIFGWIVI